MNSVRITDGKGVQFTFANGLTISIQIGGGNYSSNYDFPIGGITRDRPLPASTTAEIAVWDARGSWFNLGGDDVAGYVPVEKVLEFTEYLRKLPEGTTPKAVKLDLSLIDATLAPAAEPTP